MPRGTTKCLLLAGCPLGACAANLQEVATVQAAQRHFESGVNFYKAGDYESARIEFGTGFRVSRPAAARARS